jgi:hypothetical protein
VLLAAVDWTPIIAAAVASLPGCLAAFVSLLNRREIKTPSGDSLGRVAERTHDMTAANNMMLNKINGDLNHKSEPVDG